MSGAQGHRDGAPVRWVEPRWQYRDGRVVCFDHMQKAFVHGANPKHFTKLGGTPVCILCEKEQRNTVIYKYQEVKEEEAK
jgi:hypothetical protein